MVYSSTASDRTLNVTYLKGNQALEIERATFAKIDTSDPLFSYFCIEYTTLHIRNINRIVSILINKFQLEFENQSLYR